MGLAIDLANGWLEGSLDRRPLRRGPMTAMDRTAAKMTVAREGSFVVVKLIDDIQERLVRRHFYRSSGEAVFFSDSHGNHVDAAGRRLFYRDGALWYVGSRHQSENVQTKSLLYPSGTFAGTGRASYKQFSKTYDFCCYLFCRNHIISTIYAI
jgi:hypothetical protein